MIHPENLKLAEKSLAEVIKAEPGFISLLNRPHLLEEINTVFKKRGYQYKQFIVVGIGGSSLGVRVIRDFFGQEQLLVLENVDHADFKRMTKWVVEPKETLFVFISKSGGTLETLVSLELISEWLAGHKLELKDQTVVITENKESSLFNWAKSHQVPTLEVPLDVGGRFSVLTAVGMFPALLMGLNPKSFWQGAKLALQDREAVQQFIAASLESFDQQKRITQFWLYGTSLRSFGEWLVQLWSESLGKKLNRQGGRAMEASTPMVALGAIDQHSMLQQTMEGTQDKWPVFFRAQFLEEGGPVIHKSMFKETVHVEGRQLGDVLRVEAVATKEALQTQGCEPYEILWKDLNEEMLGYWFLFFELVVASLGEAMDINAFDQPGVELGKRLAQEKLKTEKLSR